MTKDAVTLIEAAVNTFAFASPFRPQVKETIIANTCRLKNINLQDNKTGKIDAGKPAGMLKLRFPGEERILAAGAPFLWEIGILASLSDISVITAIAVIAGITNVSRFANSKKFAAYPRSAPKAEHSNGKTVNKPAGKAGRKLSVTLLFRALNHFRDSKRKLEDRYGRLSVYKKKGIIRMALYRRVFTEIYQILKKGAYHRYQNPRLHEKKMGEYWKFLEKQGIKTQEDLQLSA